MITGTSTTERERESYAYYLIHSVHGELSTSRSCSGSSIHSILKKNEDIKCLMRELHCASFINGIISAVSLNNNYGPAVLYLNLNQIPFIPMWFKGALVRQ